MKKASVNGQPAILHSELPLFSYLPEFSSYMDIDSVGIVGALDIRGDAIAIFWQPITDEDHVEFEQHLTLG